MAISGARKLAAGGGGPRISGVRLVIGYAVMVAALAATLLGSFTLGSRLEPVPNAAGVYRLDPPAQCLGGRIEVWQSGRFTDIAGERGSGGSLELDGRRLTGKVGCADGSTAPLQATLAGEAGDRSLSGEVGGHRFRATRIRDHPEPAEAEVASGEHLTPEELFGRLMLAIAVVIVAARAVGALAGRLGQPRVMGEVLAGILLGPTLLGGLLPGVQAYLFPTQVIPLLSAAADLGLALYMFLVGLELEPGLLRGRVAQAAFVSTASVAAPLLLGLPWRCRCSPSSEPIPATPRSRCFSGRPCRSPPSRSWPASWSSAGCSSDRWAPWPWPRPRWTTWPPGSCWLSPSRSPPRPGRYWARSGSWGWRCCSARPWPWSSGG